jgi:hypothetical protein
MLGTPFTNDLFVSTVDELTTPRLILYIFAYVTQCSSLISEGQPSINQSSIEIWLIRIIEQFSLFRNRVSLSFGA